jgi:hypothetical protein
MLISSCATAYDGDGGRRVTRQAGSTIPSGGVALPRIISAVWAVLVAAVPAVEVGAQEQVARSKSLEVGRHDGASDLAPTGLPISSGRARPEVTQPSRLQADARRAVPGPPRAFARLLRCVLRGARGRRLLAGASTHEPQQDQSEGNDSHALPPFGRKSAPLTPERSYCGRRPSRCGVRRGNR